MKLSRFDAIIICISPMFMAYRFLVPGISVAEILMIISLFFHFVLATFWKSKNLLFVLIVFSIMLMHLLYVTSTGLNESVGYLRLAKFFILVLFITLAFRNIDNQSLLKAIIFVIYLNVFALFLQYLILKITGIAVPLVIPFLPLVNEDISLESINAVLSSNFRPGGLFMEPAHLSYYLFFSALFIYKSNYLNKNFILMIISVCLFSTFSSFGFLSGLIIMGLLFLNSSRPFKAFLIGILFVMIPLNLSILSFLIFEIPQLARLINPESVAITGRFFAGQGMIENLNELQKLSGLGFGNFQMNGQVNGIAYLRLSFGSVGLLIISIFLVLYIIMNFNIFSLMIISIMIVISFFSALLLTPFLLIIILSLVHNRL